MKLPAIFIDCFMTIVTAFFGLFLLLGPVKQEQTLPPIELPQSANTKAGLTQNQALKVTLKGEGEHVSILVDDQPVDKKELGQIMSSRSNKQVVLRGDKGINWGAGVKLMGYLNSLGISGISIAYEPAGG